VDDLDEPIAASAVPAQQPIGIGIITYRRLAHLRECVAGVLRHTTSPFYLVIADDGSDDGTLEWCQASGLHVVRGSNRGVCWNKNRALYHLQAHGCDPILLLEDDCVPVADGWEEPWRTATAHYGHLGYAHPKLDPWIISGTGTPEDPILNPKATGQCASVSAEALAAVGYFDTRFKGYGVGHAEWTTRLKRAGYGYLPVIDAEGRTIKANLYLAGGLQAHDGPTFRDKATVQRNERLFAKLKGEDIYRLPWMVERHRVAFVREQRKAGVTVDLE
jgi:glycosyltransferase involved in cell wall biosynthesis